MAIAPIVQISVVFIRKVELRLLQYLYNPNEILGATFEKSNFSGESPIYV